MTKGNPLDLSRFFPTGWRKLRQFCEAVETGETPDPELLAELAAAFRLMLAEPNRKKQPAVLRRALELNKTKGRKPPIEAKEGPRFEAAVRVFLADPDGLNQPDAIGTVADDLGVNESTVRRWVKRHRKSAQSTARYLLRIEKRPRKG